MARSQSRELRQPQPALSPTPLSVKPVKSWLVSHYWPFVEGYIRKALEHANGELEAEDIFHYLQSERMFLFVAQRKVICGAATCEVVQYTRKKAIRVVTLSGENFVQELHPVLIDWAGKINADGIECYVRKGFAPQLEKLGYQQIYVGLYHEVNDDGQKAGHAES